MYFLVLILGLGLSAGAADDRNAAFLRQTEAAVDSLRDAEATIYGSFTTDQPATLFTTPISFLGTASLTLTPRAHNVFNLSEGGFAVRRFSSQEPSAFVVNINGMPAMHINSFSYDETSGFHVETEIPGFIGWVAPRGIIQDGINDQIKSMLDQKYGKKMKDAFHRLKQLRHERSLGDARKLIDEIKKLFTDPASSANPFKDVTISGSVSAQITTRGERRLAVAGMVMDMHNGSELQTSVDFSATNSRYQINQVMLQMSGVHLHGASTAPEDEAVATDGSITFSARGFETNLMTNGQKTIEAGVGLFGALLGALSNGGTLTIPNCPPPPPSPALQEIIQRHTLPVIQTFVRQNRQQFISAGVNPQVIDAVLNQRPPQ